MDLRGCRDVASGRLPPEWAPRELAWRVRIENRVLLASRQAQSLHNGQVEKENPMQLRLLPSFLCTAAVVLSGVKIGRASCRERVL